MEVFLNLGLLWQRIESVPKAPCRSISYSRRPISYFGHASDIKFRPYFVQHRIQITYAILFYGHVDIGE